MRIILSLLLVLVLCRAHATTYYFSTNNGDDNRSNFQAQNPATPWKSLSKLNAMFYIFNPGDVILFNRGEVFSGSINITKSGLAGLPITFGAYGVGNKPVITGLATLNNWVSVGNGIWESYNPALGAKVNTLLINSAPQEMGRYPNSNTTNKGYKTIKSFNGNTSITDWDLSGSPNWTGGEVVIRKRGAVIDRDYINNHSGSTIYYSSSTNYGPAANDFGYFIQNHIGTLDQFGEWYYNPSQKKMSVYFGGNHPSSYSIEASSIDNLVSLSYQHNIVFDNLVFKGPNAYGVYMDNGSNITVRSCDVLFSGGDGLRVTNIFNFLMENSTVNYSNNNGINLQYGTTYSTLRNNKVTNTYTFVGMGKSSDGNGIGITGGGDGNMIEYNEVVNAGYIGISYAGNNVTVKNNLVNTFCLIKDDGAGIYTYAGDVNPPTYFGRKIIGNIVLNGMGASAGNPPSSLRGAEGISLDDNTSGVEIIGNTVANCTSFGVYYRNARNIVLKNNTFYNNDTQIQMLRYNLYGSIHSDEIINNIFFSKQKSQMVASYNSVADDIWNFGRFDSNYYARPIDDRMVIHNDYVDGNGKSIQNVFDVDGWKSVYGKDGASKRAAVQIPEYVINGVTSGNKYSGGNFDANIGGFYSWAASNNVTTSWNWGKLDGGALQVAYTQATGYSSNSVVNAGVGGLIAGKTYRLKFSLIGSSNNISMSVYIRKGAAPFPALTEKKHVKIGTTRTENELLFTVPVGDNDGVLTFEINNHNFTYWVDNLELHEVNATLTNPDDHLLFEYNAGNSNKTVALNGNYVDARNTAYSNSVVIPPYSSVVLIKQPGGTKSNQTIAFPVVPTKTYGDAAFNLNATASSGLPVTYRILSGPATLSNNVVTVNGVGTVVVEASQGGNTSYNSAAPVSQSFAVIKANQLIGFNSISNKSFGEPAFAVNATTTSGLPVSFRVLSGPASVSGNIVSLNNTGTVVLEGYQPGDANYNAAASVSQTFSVIASPTYPSEGTCSATGTILREQWNNIAGSDVSAIPVNTTPSSTSQLNLFEAVSNNEDIYGARIRGYICVPQTGNYIFTIAGDDGVELWFSYDANPANKVKIAGYSGWTGYREWNKYPAQKSGAIYLQAGKSYYIEALHKEGWGGDHVSVAWQMPNGVTEAPIPGTRLSPYTGTLPTPPTTCSATGTILREQWNNINGSDVSAIPVNTTPNSTSQLNLFEAVSNNEDIYGARIRGYICVPLTGNYIFTIAGDDGVELWLSTDANPANKVRIAGYSGWTGLREWNKYPAQKSGAIHLQAGQSYYIEALHKEGWGGDHVSVAWQMPNGVTEAPIPGNRLSPYTGSLPPTPPVVCSATGTILREQWNNVTGSDVSAIPVNTTPGSSSQLTLLEAVSNNEDIYGARIRGYVCVPLTGNYVFNISGDDGVELWLSTDGNPVNKVRIAGYNGWTGLREWNKYPEQKSAPIALQAGKSYYIEVLHKEGWGGDHVSVGWTLPNGVVEAPIPGTRLSPYNAAITSNTQRNSMSALPVVEETSIVTSSTLTAFPNPFKTTATVTVQPAETGDASLGVYDLSGRAVQQLYNGMLEKGVTKRFTLSANNLTNGVYIIRLATKGKVVTEKIVLSK